MFVASWRRSSAGKSARLIIERSTVQVCPSLLFFAAFCGCLAAFSSSRPSRLDCLGVGPLIPRAAGSWVNADNVVMFNNKI